MYIYIYIYTYNPLTMAPLPRTWPGLSWRIDTNLTVSAVHGGLTGQSYHSFVGDHGAAFNIVFQAAFTCI